MTAGCTEMKIILLKNVKNLGRVGDVVEVSGGYAANSLLPRGLARKATESGVEQIQKQKARQEKALAKKRAKKESTAERLDKREFTMKVRADAAGTIYAGVDAARAAAFLRRKGFVVEPDEIILDKPIKKVGRRDINLLILSKKIHITIDIQTDERQQTFG